MYFPSEIEKHSSDRLKECKEALAELREHVNPFLGNEFVVSSQSSLYEKVPRDGSLYFIKEGTLKCIKDDKVVFYAEEGDFVGFEGSAFDKSMDFAAEFAVVVCPFDIAPLCSNPNIAKIWYRFQGNFLSILLSGSSQSSSTEAVFSPEVRTFLPGESIIEQGSTGEEVYSLIDGIAYVYSNDKQIGEIYPDELFGAVSLLTRRPRIVSVKAGTECLVGVLSKDQFVTLTKNRPEVLFKLAQELSMAIVDLSEKNDQVSSCIKVPT